MTAVRIGRSVIGPGQPVYVIGEIGLNHNGDVEIAKRLIDVAVEGGAQAVKFQKRTPEIATPEHMRDEPRETPWGTMTYLDYRHRVEFGEAEYLEIASVRDARRASTGSPRRGTCPRSSSSRSSTSWRTRSPRRRSPTSSCSTPSPATGKPVILSTGMSTIEEIDRAVEVLGTDRLVLMHATSTYPLPAEEANLRMIDTLQRRYPGVPIGYSGHERGLQISLAAVALGAVAVERHITLDRAMWGSDQAASLEPQGLEHLVRDIRIIGEAMGDGVKRVFPGEEAPRAKLRRVPA